MKPVKRIEIVIEEIELENVISELDRIGVVGYTIVPRAAGRGERGVRYESVQGLGNVLMTIACDERQASQVIEAMRPILKRYGGVCLVSDAMWVIHDS
ncbi:MAG: nitrogen regulatory protein [Proteobacteria bacterium]|jgi:nitrogen regulatory protein PII|nr:nitrogen regulatory protein [Pseudomonadota bacterium]